VLYLYKVVHSVVLCC